MAVTSDNPRRDEPHDEAHVALARQTAVAVERALGPVRTGGLGELHDSHAALRRSTPEGASWRVPRLGSRFDRAYGSMGRVRVPSALPLNPLLLLPALILSASASAPARGTPRPRRSLNQSIVRSLAID